MYTTNHKTTHIYFTAPFKSHSLPNQHQLQLFIQKLQLKFFSRVKLQSKQKKINPIFQIAYLQQNQNDT